MSKIVKVKHLNRDSVSLRMPKKYAISLRYFLGMMRPKHLDDLCKDDEMKKDMESLFVDLANSEIDIRDSL